MGPGEHRNRVKLHGADPPHHPGDAAAPRRGPEESLRVKGDPPHLVGAQPKVTVSCCCLIIPNECG
jgi:hypothetical protein